MRQTIARAMVVATALALAIPARAQDANTEKNEAKEHYLKGTKHFNLGRFDDAIKEYELAYEAKDDPVLLYNIAQAHRLAGHHEKAYFYYRSYLQAAPKSPIRDEVNAKIEELRKIIAQESKVQNMPPTAPLPPKAAHAETTPTVTPPPVSPPPPEPKPQPKPQVVASAPKPQPPPPPPPEPKPKPVEARPVEAQPTPPPPVVPPPSEVRPTPTETTPAGTTLTASAPEKKPIYKKWWFWTAIGGAVVIGAVVGVSVAAPAKTTLASDCRFGVGRVNCAH
jgi:hypothetical protein